jgi:hypothetical protein
MGSSRVIMLSGIYLMLGFYTVSFYRADRTNGTTVEAVANTVQAEQLARTGISMALSMMGNDLAAITLAPQNAALSSGNISFQAAPISASSSKITSTAVFNGRTITMTAVFTYDRGRWRITRAYTPPTAELIS